MWYAAGKKWVMSLATKDKTYLLFIQKTLKLWTKESEFGEHPAYPWRCLGMPRPVSFNRCRWQKLWCLIVNINPGGPAWLCSATQYFTGDFDGENVTPNRTDTRWLDEGTDEYAGVTWHNMGNRSIFLGWMSNWAYAEAVPTKPWRSAMTVPRELKLVKIDTGYFVAAEPVKELGSLKSQTVDLHNIKVKGEVNITKLVKRSDNQYELSLSSGNLKSFDVTLSNKGGEQLIAGYDEVANSWYIDRTKAGEASFNKEFAKKITATRKVKTKSTDLKLVIDAASIELFADKGLSVMTAILFPKKPYDKLSVSSKDMTISDLSYSSLKSIWH